MRIKEWESSKRQLMIRLERGSERLSGKIARI
jgi:hypothetical protein